MISGFFSNTLNWPEFIENFLASCSQQQYQVKSSTNARELKRLSLWQVTAEYLQKIKPCFFTSCFNRANGRAKFDYWCERKIVLPSLWSDNMDIETKDIFQKDSLCRYWPKKFFILTSCNTGKKLMLIEGCLSTSFNVLSKYL